MRLRILFFAAAREAAGMAETTIDVAPGATVGTVFDVLSHGRPSLGPLLRGCRAAVDEEFAPATRPLEDGQTLAILPPVSGG